MACWNGIASPAIRSYLQAAVNAWEDIVANRLYITGTASADERFHGDYDLPNTGKVGETCVTVTWLQLNAHLLRLTGEARFAEQLEHTILQPTLRRPAARRQGLGLLRRNGGQEALQRYARRALLPVQRSTRHGAHSHLRRHHRRRGRRRESLRSRQRRPAPARRQRGEAGDRHPVSRRRKDRDDRRCGRQRANLC